MCTTNNGNRIEFRDFLNHFGISIQSKNLFKSGKYLSRVFRPVRFGNFFQELDVYLNTNSRYSGKVTDGISLFSIDLAHALGWENAKAGMSAQFTLFYKNGLVKGHCVISDKINHDIVIYGKDNIKSEIALTHDLEYVTLEPVKLSETLRMDIQSMLNLWDLFDERQFLSWAHKGMIQFKTDLLSGKLSEWINVDSYHGDSENEKWALRKAILSGIDYTKFPGLIRLGWTSFRNSMICFAEKSDGQPVFRIPVPGGKRGYIRVDLRDHDDDGNFVSIVERGTVELDWYGNIWIPQDDIVEFMEVKGGADQDDNCAIIPVEDGKAVIYRSPNQYGEYGIHKIKAVGFELVHNNKLVGEVPMKSISSKESSARESFSSGNKLLESYLSGLAEEEDDIMEYNKANLLKTYMRIKQNSANIGVAANAEMIRSAVGLASPEQFDYLINLFDWNLENIIDSTVKDGKDAKDDMTKVWNLMNYVVDNKIEVPQSILHRFPEKMRMDVSVSTNHSLDELLGAIKFLIDKTDKEILGSGTSSKGNRITGVIDKLDTPVIELGLNCIESPLYGKAVEMLKRYNKRMAILLDSSENKETKTETIYEGIENIQQKLLGELSNFNNTERLEIVNLFAYEIYKSGSVHDSILWIADKNDLRGTAMDTIQMLAALKTNMCNDKEISIKTEEAPSQLNYIRIWSKGSLCVSDFQRVSEVEVKNDTVEIGGYFYKLGDECIKAPGRYKVDKIEQTISKVNNQPLDKSLTVLLS